MKASRCAACGTAIEVYDGYEEKRCCSGLSEMCGCMGQPINPMFCDSCEEKIFGKSMKQHREEQDAITKIQKT